jgi:hypothetical protein
MDNVFVFLLLAALVTCLISAIGFLIKWITKKPKKKWGIVAIIAFTSFWVVGIMWGLSLTSNSEKVEITTDETVEETTSQPTKEPGSSKPIPDNSAAKDSETVSTDSSEKVDSSVTFAEIYREFKRNELNAKDLYNGNRYMITAKVNGMATGGLLNLTGGATLTMELQVDNTVVFFTAEFEKEQEENLKQISVGDTITFIGTCYGGSFTDCELQ